MASRKTDFNTEDIMGSLLGMKSQEKENNEEKKKDKKEVQTVNKENTSGIKEEDIEPSYKEEYVPYTVEKEREYIPIENIRIRRKDEKDMKVPVSFSLSRKTAEQLKQIAYVERLSSSEIVSGLIEAYIHAHQGVLDEYNDLLRRRRM